MFVLYWTSKGSCVSQASKWIWTCPHQPFYRSGHTSIWTGIYTCIRFHHVGCQPQGERGSCMRRLAWSWRCSIVRSTPFPTSYTLLQERTRQPGLVWATVVPVASHETEAMESTSSCSLLGNAAISACARWYEIHKQEDILVDGTFVVRHVPSIYRLQYAILALVLSTWMLAFADCNGERTESWPWTLLVAFVIQEVRHRCTETLDGSPAEAPPSPCKCCQTVVKDNGYGDW
jgi:hypothetical protein